MQQAISLDTAVQLTNVSRRTLWRRVNEGSIARCGTDERGRALLALQDVAPLLCIELTDEDAELLQQADQGDSEAQNELGILCLEQAYATRALHWFLLAAEQDHADAMHHLSALYLHGAQDLGGGGGYITKNSSQALMWLSKAALHGHLIAQAQLDAL